jgi:hypothetical protein
MWNGRNLTILILALKKYQKTNIKKKRGETRLFLAKFHISCITA